MSNKALNWAWDVQDIEPGELLVLLCLADHHNKDDGLCCPGIPRIMRRTKQSRATVFRHLKSLNAKGLIDTLGDGRFVLAITSQAETTESQNKTPESQIATEKSQNETHNPYLNPDLNPNHNHTPGRPLKGAPSPTPPKGDLRSKRARQEGTPIDPEWTFNSDHLFEAEETFALLPDGGTGDKPLKGPAALVSQYREFKRKRYGGGSDGPVVQEETVITFVERSAKKFLNHHLGKGDRSPDWDALFMDWLMGDLNKLSRGRVMPRPQPGQRPLRGWAKLEQMKREWYANERMSAEDAS